VTIGVILGVGNESEVISQTYILLSFATA